MKVAACRLVAGLGYCNVLLCSVPLDCSQPGLSPRTRRALADTTHQFLFMFEDKSRGSHLAVEPGFSSPTSWPTHSLAEHTAYLLVGEETNRVVNGTTYHHLMGSPYTAQVGCELRVIFLLRMQSCVHILRVPETSYQELSSCLQGPYHSERWIKAWPRRRSADSARSLRKLFVLLGGSRAEILSPRKSIGESF